MQLADMGRTSDLHCVEAGDVPEISLIDSRDGFFTTFVPQFTWYMLFAGTSGDGRSAKSGFSMEDVPKSLWIP